MLLLKISLNEVHKLKGTRDKIINIGDDQVLQTYKKAWSNQMFKIPRSAISNIVSLDNTNSFRVDIDKNCIYFLIGKSLDKKDVYVGQAGTRSTSSATVIARLKEHDKNNDTYKNSWDTALVLVPTESDKWGATEISLLENMFVTAINTVEYDKINTAPTNTREHTDEDEQLYMEECFQQGVFYSAIFGCNAFSKKEADDCNTTKLKIANNKELSEYETVIIQLSGTALDTKSKIKEVTTPTYIVKNMLDMYDWETFNKDTVFLDPACKTGEFLFEIRNRLFEIEMKNGEFDSYGEFAAEICWQHISTKQLFGIATSEGSCIITKMNLFGTISNVKNIVYIEDYINTIRGKNVRDGEIRSCIQQLFKRETGLMIPKKLEDSTLEHIERQSLCGIKYKDLIWFKEKLYKELNNVKFDVIIGNPPYQENNGGGRCGGVQLYSEFVTRMASFNPTYLSMVIPAKWYIANKDHSDFSKWMMENKHIKILRDFEKPSDIFNNVAIGGGVCYFLIDSNYSGECTVDNCRVENDQVVIKHSRKCKLNTFNLNADHVFIRGKLDLDIVNKILAQQNNYMSTSCSNTSPFGLATTFSGNAIRMKDSDIEVIKSYDCIEYVERDYITKGLELINKYNVVVGTLNAGGGKALLVGDQQTTVINKPKILMPGQVCTLTYMVICSFDTLVEAENCANYLKTRLVRFLIESLVGSAYMTYKQYRIVPYLDFSKCWTERELYQKYNISDEEVEYIESKIKVMK